MGQKPLMDFMHLANYLEENWSSFVAVMSKEFNEDEEKCEQIVEYLRTL